MSHPAIQELLEHATALRRLARDLVGAAAAEDVVQEAAVQALTKPPRRHGPAIGWLRSVVRHLASKHRRSEGVRRRHEAASLRSEAFVEAGAETVDTLRSLTELVTTLPEPYRATLLARYLREQSPSEIAAATGVPVRTVKTRLQRGLQFLRERYDERGPEWRGALCSAFGLERSAVPVVVGIGATAKAVWVLGAVSVSLGAWYLLGATPPATDRSPETVAAPVSARADAGALDASGAIVPAIARTPAPTPARSAAARPGVGDIVVQAVDSTTGSAIEHFALRETLMHPSFEDVPLLHAGMHVDGRLVLSQSWMGQRVFVIADTTAGRLPSRWFRADDAVDRNGERTIEVRIPAPVQLTLRVVCENGGAPVARTRVEVLRPWPGSSEITLRTSALSPEKFHALPDEAGAIANFTGGRALLLASGETDSEGRVPLRAPPGEELAVRLLGPGHRPAVKAPFIVSAQPEAEVVATVSTGGTIRGRVLPAAALRPLRPDLDTSALRGDATFLAMYATGVRLRHKQTGESFPAPRGLVQPVGPLAEDGTFVLDGLAPGDWQVFFAYPLQLQEPRPDAPLSDVGSVEVELPTVSGLAECELRVIDVDVSSLLPGRLDTSITREGQPLRDGTLLISPIAPNGAPLPRLRMTPNLQFRASDRLEATLPPARYFAKWLPGGPLAVDLPLGEFAITSGMVTRIHFVVDVVSAYLRVTEADGETPSPGQLQLFREGWATHRDTDSTGHASFLALPRRAELHARFYRSRSSEPIDLGTVLDLGESPGVTLLRLPAR